jgi:hypothetical protein
VTTVTLSRIVRFGLILAAGVAVVGALVGYFTVGIEGLASGLLAAALSLVFAGISALAITVGERLAAHRDSIAPVLISVLVGWAVKFVVFLAAVTLLREASFLDALAFYGMSFVALLGSLAVDAIVLAPVVIAATWTKPGDQSGKQ